MTPTPTGPSSDTRPFIVLMILLWLAGIAMRIAILAIPPIVPLIRTDLGMSETQVGLLIGIPLMVFALASVPGSLLTARLGASAAIMIGFAIAGFAAGGRALSGDVWSLYVATAIMGFGIALVQPAVPSLMREWAPHRLGLATAVSSNGILIGVAAAPALTHPFVLPLTGQNWRGNLVVWAIPVVVVAAIFLVLKRWLPGAPPSKGAPRRWWPNWRSGETWLLGVTFGCNNSLFFGANAFLADSLVHHGRPDLVGAAVGWLNGAQLLASTVLLTLAQRLEGRPLPFVVGGPASLIGVLGIAFGEGAWVVASAGLLGFSLAITFALALVLPARLGAASDVHRLSAGMFTISYAMAVAIPTLSGALWDATGQPVAAFAPLGVCAILLAVFGGRLSTRAREPA